MRPILTMVLLSAALAMAAPAAPQTTPERTPQDEMTEKQREAAELARQATEMLMKAMDLIIQSIPQYGPPEIDEHGNIIIPRIPREEHPPAPDHPTPEEGEPTETLL
jgi:hypothetical protein